MKQRRLFRFQVLLFVAAILLCFGARIVNLGTEVGMRVVVTGIGIDRGADGYRLSAQIFTPILGETKAQQKTVVTAEGKTVGQAISKLSLRTGRLAAISHCKLIVLGASLHDENVADTVKYFVSDLQVGWGAIVVCTSGTAEDTVGGLTDLERQSEFNWQEFLNANREVDGIAANSIREILLRLQDRSRSVLLTVLDIEKSGGSSGGSGGSGSSGGGAQEASESGSSGGSSGGSVSLKAGEKTAVLREGKVVGTLDGDEMRGFSWFDPEVKQSQFEVAAAGGTADVRLKTKTVSVRLGERDGAPAVDVRIRALFDLAEAPCDIFTEAPTERIEAAVAEKIAEDIRACVRRALALDTDILGFNDRFFRFRPAVFARHGDALFRETEVRLDIVARLDD